MRRLPRHPLLLGFCLLLSAAACLAPRAAGIAPSGTVPSGAAQPGVAPAVRNPLDRSAVLFIADGLGPAYVTATRMARGGEDGVLNLDSMPYTAIVRTYAFDDPVTDSAAAATAMACGRKTVNGVLGQDSTAVYGQHDGRPLESITTWARRRGLRVGIVTTARVTHATPAAFYASHNDRDLEEAIARQALGADLDLLLGGGREMFRRTLEIGEANLEKRVAERGWRLVTDAAGLEAVAAPEDRVLGLFADDHMPYEPERVKMEAAAAAPAARRGSAAVPSLTVMTVWSIGRLSQGGRPFLLVVEGGRPDHAAHENWALTLIDEVAAFDDAVGAALGRLDPATTLVLATGDHETGGLAISSRKDSGTVLTFATGPGTKQKAERAPHSWSDLAPTSLHDPHGEHTAVDVPLYAWGAGADQVHGTLENTAVFYLLRAHLEGKTPDRDSLVHAAR